MPLVRIDLIEGRAPSQVVAIGDGIARALTEIMNVPERDRFQVITEHKRDRFIYNKSYLGIERTDGIVFIQVTLSRGRTIEQKQAFYARVADLLARNAQVRPEDVAISLIESTREDWSFGNGVAQYVVLPKEEWK